ncbi:MAG TPA: RpiB/LacA/LacB family sugar-phosphate isomerase [Spirochaetia bacterium]|nr:RpiB/LacA/LacB family sugar-phosphate isomerase [Spirochaetia bacterium]
MAKIAIGCDPNASELKAVIMLHVHNLGHEAEDYGSDDPIYANTAIRVAEAVAAGRQHRGILICGTGIGMSIAANKVNGAYAALVADPYSAERARKSNNANIMCLGAQTMGEEVAKYLVTIWLSSEYSPGGRSEPKIQRIYSYERNHAIDQLSGPFLISRTPGYTAIETKTSGRSCFNAGGAVAWPQVGSVAQVLG